MIRDGSESRHVTPNTIRRSSYTTRTSVISVAGSPVFGSCWRKSDAGSARRHASSVSRPSSVSRVSPSRTAVTVRGSVTDCALGCGAEASTPIETASTRRGPRDRTTGGHDTSSRAGRPDGGRGGTGGRDWTGRGEKGRRGWKDGEELEGWEGLK